MFFANFRRSLAETLLSILLVVHNHGLDAAVLSYDSCRTDSNNSYSVGGWCFCIYRNSSWPSSYPVQDVAQTMCGPNGNLAVGVTYKMLNKIMNLPRIADALNWLALLSNSTTANQGWMWNTLLPNGRYATFPAITSNILWRPAEPNNGGGIERSAVIVSDGAMDINKNFTQASVLMAVVCQFASRVWQYPQRGHGRFTSSTFKIVQSNIPKINCLRQCHHHPGCVSLAYNPTNNDCQLYNASPEDPRFVANVTADSTYDWHIRDGMEY